MMFEYVSDSLDLVESFWRFFIPEHNISVPFVLVGHTLEPSLSFDRSHINLREILVGKNECTVLIVVWSKKWIDE